MNLADCTIRLNEDDLNSMYYSIENRSPFLVDLVEISPKYPPNI